MQVAQLQGVGVVVVTVVQLDEGYVMETESKESVNATEYKVYTHGR